MEQQRGSKHVYNRIRHPVFWLFSFLFSFTFVLSVPFVQKLFLFLPSYSPCHTALVITSGTNFQKKIIKQLLLWQTKFFSCQDLCLYQKMPWSHPVPWRYRTIFKVNTLRTWSFWLSSPMLSRSSTLQSNPLANSSRYYIYTFLQCLSSRKEGYALKQLPPSFHTFNITGFIHINGSLEQIYCKCLNMTVVNLVLILYGTVLEQSPSHSAN